MIETVNEHCEHPDCKYRGRFSHVDDACFYMYYTGNRRGCDISKCDKYKTGRIDTVLTLDGVIYRGLDDDV